MLGEGYNIDGTTAAYRRKGRPKTARIDNIKKWRTKLSLEKALRSTADRKPRRAAVYAAANPRVEDG